AQASELNPSAKPVARRRHSPAGLTRPTSRQDFDPKLRRNGQIPISARPSKERLTKRWKGLFARCEPGTTAWTDQYSQGASNAPPRKTTSMKINNVRNGRIEFP